MGGVKRKGWCRLEDDEKKVSFFHQCHWGQQLGGIHNSLDVLKGFCFLMEDLCFV